MHVATFLQDLAGGGAERIAVLLMNGLAERHRVSLVLARREGPYLKDLHPAVAVHDLGGKSTMRSVPSLAQWLRRERPDVLVSHLTHVNVGAAIANRLAGHRTPQVAVEHNQMGLNYERLNRGSVKLAYRLAGRAYGDVARIVSVSGASHQPIRSPAAK